MECEWVGRSTWVAIDSRVLSLFGSFGQPRLLRGVPGKGLKGVTIM